MPLVQLEVLVVEAGRLSNLVAAQQGHKGPGVTFHILCPCPGAFDVPRELHATFRLCYPIVVLLCSLDMLPVQIVQFRDLDLVSDYAAIVAPPEAGAGDEGPEVECYRSLVGRASRGGPGCAR